MAERIRHEPTEPLNDGAVGLRVIRTIGRRSRRWHDTPIGVLRLRGRSYAVCPDARRDWARNLAHDSRCTLAAGGQDWPAVAVPASGTAAVQAVRGYLAAAVPWAVAAFPVRSTTPDDVIRAHLPQMAVFELRSDDGSWLR